MANSSHKKAIILEGQLRKRFTWLTVIITILYCLIRFWWYNVTATLDCMVMLFIFTALTLYTMKWLLEKTRTGNLGTIDYFQDIIYINWFVQIISCWTNWAFLAYLLIPGYVIWKFSPLIRPLLFQLLQLVRPRDVD